MKINYKGELKKLIKIDLKDSDKLNIWIKIQKSTNYDKIKICGKNFTYKNENIYLYNK